MPGWLARNLPAGVLFAATLVAWQLAVTVFEVREYLLPSPLAVLRALGGAEVPWLVHLWITTVEIVGAFAVAAVVGIALGVAIAWSSLLAKALVPFLVFVNTLPKVAVAPLFLLWLGYGVVPNMLIGALIGFFPVVINTAVGRFALNWFAVGDHAAYWVALDKGYYRARGLDVELQNSKGSGDSIAKVDTGRAHIGLADSAVVIAAVARGAKVKVVGMVFDKTPLNVWSWKDAPITRPKDLEGKTVGAPPGDGQRQVFPAFAKLHGIDQSKVTWVNVEPAAKVPALAEKRVNAVADYTTGLPFYEKAMGKGNAVMMPWADHGFDMYSMSIIASDRTMREHAKTLRAFLEASYLGWRDVMDDPKAALEIFKKRVPEIDLSIIEPNMMLGLELMKTDRYARQGIGWMDERKMCASVDLVNTYMGVARKVDCREVYTNDFLTKVEPPTSMR